MSTPNNLPENKKTGVILMTYGSATTAEDVPEYFQRIYKGKASPELIADFENRYKLIGRSPLIDITKKQAADLQTLLEKTPNGKKYIVRAGMRHSQPFIADAVADCRAGGAEQLIGIIISPQFSSNIMGGYITDFMQTATQQGFAPKNIKLADAWGTEPHFIDLLANQINESETKLQNKYGILIPVIFTTHSLPQKVVAQDSGYLQQLQDTIDAVRVKLNPDLKYFAGYQSAGHTPEEWLKPDLIDIVARLQGKTPAVLIAPIQFLADHLEILYDLDIAARAQCKKFDIEYNRINLPNTDKLFIAALAAITNKYIF